MVRDDTWMEVFTTKSGCIAVVQASGPDYPDTLARALAYPVNSWTGWGHSSTRAAYIYQHRTSLRDKMIADEISRRVEAEQT